MLTEVSDLIHGVKIGWDRDTSLTGRIRLVAEETAWTWKQYKWSIMAKGVGLAIAGGAATAYYGSVGAKHEADDQLINQKSHQAVTDTLGVHRHGTIFNGVAIKKSDNPVDRKLNQKLQETVSAQDPVLGCKHVTLSVDAEKSNALRFIFQDKVTVDVFKDKDFANGDYTCAGQTLEPSIPRPLSPIVPSNIKQQNLTLRLTS